MPLPILLSWLRFWHQAALLITCTRYSFYFWVANFSSHLPEELFKQVNCILLWKSRGHLHLLIPQNLSHMALVVLFTLFVQATLWGSAWYTVTATPEVWVHVTEKLCWLHLGSVGCCVCSDIHISQWWESHQWD